MKKLIHKTKFSKIYVLITFFIAIVIIGITTSCEEKENKTVSDNTETVVKSVNIRLLFSESLVQAMLADISVYNISVNSHGILEFNNSEDLNEVIEILQNYSLQFEDTLELYPDYPILYAFEEHYNFSSLRRQIEDKVNALENRDALMLDNDPDDHYIVSNYGRTILTPDCEVVINGLICIICYDFTVVVNNNNYDKEGDIINLIGRRPPERQLELFMAEYMLDSDVHILGGDEFPDCYANFTYQSDPSNNLKYYFTNYSTGNNYNNLTYRWEINETCGTTVYTQKDPTITFCTSSAGETVVVTLIVKSYGSECSRMTKEIKVGNCNADFTYTIMPSGQVFFYSTSSPSYLITNYTWTFGYNNLWTSAPYQTSHDYAVPGNYSVTLTVQTSEGCTSKITKTISIGNFCCRINDITEKNIYYNNNNNRLHCTLHYSGIWPFRWITAKTVNYKKKSNDSWKQEKADKIGVDFSGRIFYPNCTFYRSLHNDQHEKNNKKTYFYSYFPPDNFRVGTKSLNSWYKIKNAGTNEDAYTGLQLHNEENHCD